LIINFWNLLNIDKISKFYLIFNNKYTKINNIFFFLLYIKKKNKIMFWFNLIYNLNFKNLKNKKLNLKKNFIKYNYFCNIKNINNYKDFEKKII